MQKLKPTKRVIARCIIAGLAIINSILGILGITTIDIDDNTIYTLVTLCGDLYLVWAVWKDNSITQRACALEVVKKAIKEDGIMNVVGHLLTDISEDLEEEETNGNTIDKEA